MNDDLIAIICAIIIIPVGIVLIFKYFIFLLCFLGLVC